MGDFPDGLNVDRWQVAHFGPPCFVKLDVGSAPAGAGMRQAPDRSRWMGMWNLNAITPETEKTAHYFFAQAYNFKLGEQWISDMLRVQVRDIFLQDMAMVKAQQINMDLGPGPVVNLGQDKAWVAMRQIVDRLVKEEQQTAKAARIGGGRTMKRMTVLLAVAAFMLFVPAVAPASAQVVKDSSCSDHGSCSSTPARSCSSPWRR